MEYAELETIDLTLLDSPSPQTREELVKAAKKALIEDGFLFVTGTGVSSETLKRNLAIAQFAISGLSYEEKLPSAAELDKGSYKGYKLRGIWKRDGGVPDNIEVGPSSFQLGSDHPTPMFERQAIESKLLMILHSTTTSNPPHSSTPQPNTQNDSYLFYPKSKSLPNIRTNT